MDPTNSLEYTCHPKVPIFLRQGCFKAHHGRVAHEFFLRVLIRVGLVKWDLLRRRIALVFDLAVE